MKNDSLGDRMKSLESHETERYFMPCLPIYARLDGRGFSKFTKGMNRPFDIRMCNSMVETLKTLVEKTHATIGYSQSDEISLVWNPLSNNNSNSGNKIPLFNGKIHKINSVLSSLATAAFIKALKHNFSEDWEDLMDKLPHFDCRAIQMPNLTETSNMLLWRNLDCTKNSISMAAHTYYSHKELQNKSGADKQEMLFAKGINFNDYPSFFKRGSWVRRETVKRCLTPDELNKIPKKYRSNLFDDHSNMVTRTEIKVFDLPPLNKISNRIQVLFEGTEPILN